ncbi:hypothetical protein GW7_12655, partial [Heterocephalus glaber]
MEPPKLFCIAFRLCSLTCSLFEAEASPPSRLPGFGMQEKSGWKPCSRGNQMSWLSNFRAHLGKLIRNAAPPAAMLGTL